MAGDEQARHGSGGIGLAHERQGLCSEGDKGVKWNTIETAPKDIDILVCVTQNLGDENSGFETTQWVDSLSNIPEYNLLVYKTRIDIPFPPTHWMHLPIGPFGEST
jgi:hypothetical protein